MTCGIYLGILLICFPQALQVCCSWASLEGRDSWTDDTNSPVVHGRFAGSSPQDEFRQVYMVKGNSADTGVMQRPYGEQHTASQTRRKVYPSVQYYPNSLVKPRWHNVDFPNVNVPPKRGFGVSSSMPGASASSSLNQHSGGGVRTLLGQQGTQHTGQYAPSQPNLHRPTVSPQEPSAWKPHHIGTVQKKPDLDTSAQLTGINGNGDIKLPNEFRKPTSGLARGRKVYLKNGFSQHSSTLSLNPLIPKIQPYEIPISQYFGVQQSHQGSAYNKNPRLVSMHTGLSLGGERPGLEQQFAPTIVHHIPWSYGGHPIKRLGDDDDEEPMEQTTTTETPKKQVTLLPTNTYTFPTRHREPYRPRQSKVPKSKWIKIRSNQLTGSPGVHIEPL